MPEQSAILLCDPERIRARAADLVATSEEFLQASWAAAASGGEAPIDLGSAAFRTLDDVRLETLGLGHTWFTISPFGLDLDEKSRAVDMEAAAAYRGDTTAALDRHPCVGRRRHAGRLRRARRTARRSAPSSGWPRTTSPRRSTTR